MKPPRIRTRSGRRPRARFHASWSPAGRLRARRTLVRLVGVLGGLLAVLLIGANVYAVSFLDSLPSVRNVDASQWSGDTFIQDRNGNLLADIGKGGDRRVNVGLDQISDKVVQGTISVEDRTFWTNPGFDSEAIIRTAATNFRAGSIAGGGSTITQQLAKQLFLTREQNLERKAKEVVLAYQLSQTYSKKKILELYLNVSYYGSQQYGVQAAAQTYFHRDAKSVDLAQAAMLAGLPQSPDLYSPVDHFEAAKTRQKEVLDAMVRDGAVTPHDAALAYDEQLQIFPPVNNYKAPRFVGYVQRELTKLGFNPGQQQLTVKTTLDYPKQQLAEQTVADNFKAQLYRDKNGRLSSAMVAMNPSNGQILAYVGSPDPNADQFDFVDQKLINPGSSVKPFTYGAAIRDGKITMDTPIVDGPSPYVIKQPGAPPYQVKNYDENTHGTLPARRALANSLNIPAVKVELAEGVPQVVDFYRDMGMHPQGGGLGADAPDTSYGASLTLGGYGITLLQEVTALSTYAAMGTYHPAEAILEVKDLNGHVLYQADPNRGIRQAVDPGVAYIMAQIMSDDTNRGISFPLNGPLHLAERHAAAKTGTSENFHDGLTVGFTPDLATVFWIGDTAGADKNGNLPAMTKGSDGVIVAAPAWHKFMVAALKGVPDKWYDMPADVVKQGNSYFLKGSTKIDKLPGDNPSPTPSASTGPNGIPPDPGTGPRPVVDPRLCQLGIPLPGCPSPTPRGLPPAG